MSGVVMCTLIGVWIVAGIGPQLLLSREAQATLFRILGPACAVLPFVSIAAAFVAGWWLKLISRNRLVLAAAIVAAMFAAAHLSGFRTGQSGSYLPLLWGCCLIPSALAAAPLAVWWNRHR